MVGHTRPGTPTAGRGTGFRDTRPRVSAAVAVARAAVPNFIDDGAGAFEHEARGRDKRRHRRHLARSSPLQGPKYNHKPVSSGLRLAMASWLRRDLRLTS